LFKKPVSSLPHALLHRHTMIDHLLRESGCKRVLELASGLSRRGAAFSDMLDYTEIDLPPVIDRKRALLERTDEGKAVLARLHLVGADVETADLAAQVKPEPLFVIAEGLMMYLTAPARQKLFARIRELGSIAGELRFVFDLVPTSEEPEPGAVGRALEVVMKKFTGGRTFERDARTRNDVLGELGAAGFVDARAIAASDVADAWHLPHPAHKTTMVVFTAAWPATQS
jgi:O-methyltransferase involved in polyketide biosynthesis